MNCDNRPIKLMKSSFLNENEMKKKLSDFILNSDRMSMGPFCSEFETAYSSFQDCKYTTFLNSGSSANLALIQALLNLGRLSRGDKVAFSAVTWATNVMPLIQLGLVPVPVDVDPETINIDSKRFLKLLENVPDVKCLFISNILGFCGDLDMLGQICLERSIILIEDNCESFGSEFQQKKLGNFGLASTCSTFVGHHLSTIEGGVVCTDDRELDVAVKLVRAHGWDRNIPQDDQKALRSKYKIDEFYNLYTFYDLAYNLRPTEISGFVGVNQIRLADVIIKNRADNFRRFNEAACLNRVFLPLRVQHLNVISNFAFPLIFKNNEDFSNYRRFFEENNVEIRPIVGGNMVRQPFFAKYCTGEWNLPGADLVHSKGFYFPNNPEMEEFEIERIVSLLKP